MTHCPTCGSEVKVVSGDEGTNHWEEAKDHEKSEAIREWLRRAGDRR